MSAATQQSKIESHVQSIRADIESGITYEAAGIECPEEYGSDPAETITALDYLEGVLDIEYIVSRTGGYLGARVLVAYGGPNIWINTRTQEIEGYWWGDSARASYIGDAMGLDDALRELWECR
jgi:hypothetical protein